MPTHICQHTVCSAEFYSKHSTAKYCGRKCAGTATMQKPDVRAKVARWKYTNEDLLRGLVEQAEVLGRTPSRREVTPNERTFRERFGTYTAAVIAAGLAPNIPLPSEYFNQDRPQVPLSLRFQVLQRDGFRCQYCGGTPQDGYVLHVDHRIPRSAGGPTEMSNLVTACYLCNSGKSDMLMVG